jgi:hypothetical protein
MLYPSADLRTSSAFRQMAVDWYIKGSCVIHTALSQLVKMAFPDEWERYQRVYQKGRWIKYQGDECCLFLGEAIIWKLQVEPHIDVLDEGFCLCFPTGSLSGGRAVFPDLDLVLRSVHRKASSPPYLKKLFMLGKMSLYFDPGHCIMQ